MCSKQPISVSRLKGSSAVSLVAISLSGLLVADPAGAWAQAAIDTADTNPESAIVVTAQRRAERLEDVPIAITAVDSEVLQSAGVERVTQLPTLVPGLRLDQSGAFSQPTIRGVGSSVAGPGLSTNVATYVDGFYVPNSLSSDLQLMSVESVQVLKGPQGTLFGRNATGGAILVTTKDPTYTPELIAKASYASYDRSTLGFYGSTGLTDRLAFNVTGFYDRGDGFLENVVTGREEGQFEKWAVRAKLLFEPTDDVRFVLGYGHQDTDDPTANAKNSYDGLSAGAPRGAVAPSKRGDVANNYEPVFTLNGDVAFLTSEFDLGFATLKSYTQYRDERSYIQNDNDSSSLSVVHSNYRSIDKSFTQEFNLSSNNDDRLQWLLGAYYFWNDVRFPSVQVASLGGPFMDTMGSVNKVNAYAAYADVTYEVTDRLFLTGGLRYSIEDADATLRIPGRETELVSESWKSFTPRAVVRYEVADNASVYASYSRGFKSGQIPTAGGRATPVDPEKIDAFEIGFKTGGRGLRMDVAAYYYDYKDLQVTAFLSPGSITRNAASSEIYGIEAQLSADLTPEFSVSAGVSYNHAQYDEFPEAVGFVPSAGGFFVVDTVDASGFTMQRAPRWTGNLNANYHRQVAGGEFAINGNLYLTSKIYFDQVEQYHQDGYALLNLSAAWTTPDEHWTFTIFGNNVTDSRYRNQIQPASGAIQQQYGEPATVGASVAYRF